MHLRQMELNLSLPLPTAAPVLAVSVTFAASDAPLSFRLAQESSLDRVGHGIYGTIDGQV